MMDSRRSALAAVAAAAAIALAGCTQSDRNQTQAAANDEFIAAQVHAKALAIDAATVTLLHVTCVNGIVTLEGRISSAKERAAIEAAARTVDGVHDVIDHVAIDPRAPTGAQMEADLALAARIKAALAAQIGVNAASVHVDVHRGVVTLTGTLPTPAHREVADETVRGIRGVVRLIDEIAITKP